MVKKAIIEKSIFAASRPLSVPFFLVFLTWHEITITENISIYIFFFTVILISHQLKKRKTEQAVEWNSGLPLLGVRIDFSILIWSIEIEFQKIEKNRFSESRFNQSSKNRLKIDIARLMITLPAPGISAYVSILKWFKGFRILAHAIILDYFTQIIMLSRSKGDYLFENFSFLHAGNRLHCSMVCRYMWHHGKSRLNFSFTFSVQKKSFINHDFFLGWGGSLVYIQKFC